MNIGFISTRLAGTDGVSLETDKVALTFERSGHNVFYCAGELGESAHGLEFPEMHFNDPLALSLGNRAFAGVLLGDDRPDRGLLADIAARAASLKSSLRLFLESLEIDYVVAENIFAIPMQLPLAQALTELLRETNIPGLAHNHDFYWERQRFTPHRLGDFLDRFFPPDLPNLTQATINSLAQNALHRRRGLDSVLIPNVFDFETPPPGIDDYNADFRQAIGLSPGDWLILQPTRVVPRKGIELAIELVARWADRRAKLVITHEAGDEGLAYLDQLRQQAAASGVDLLYMADRVAESRGRRSDGRKIYSLWDAYPHADLVTYPSLIEGFGNALLETIYFRRPALVNRYAVYAADIGPKGFQFAEIDGAITAEAVALTYNWLQQPESAVDAVETNYELGRRYYAYQALAKILNPLLGEVQAGGSG